MENISAFPPGPDALPFFGNLLAFQKDQLTYLECLHRDYHSMATIHFGNKPAVVLFEPEHIRALLTEQARNFTPTQTRGGDLMEVLGEGLLTIEGEVHREQRRFVQPAFHKKRVEQYADTMVQYTLDMLATWHEGEELDMANEMQELTLRIVARSLFGIELIDEAKELGQQFGRMVERRRSILARLLNIYLDLPFTNYGRRMAARRKIDAFVYKLMHQRRAEAHDSGDVLSMLMAAQDEGASLTDSQVRDHVLTLLAAGHETTANALVWTFYLLAQNPGPREKLLSELQTVLAGRAPTLNDLPNLPYTEWVVSESMRFYPPVWMMGRVALTDVEMGGYHFPEGTVFLLSQWLLHRDPAIWHDPETFRPERWDPDQREKVAAWSYFPFGGGPRICIGMPFAQLEAKLLLATIMQRYTTRLVPGFKIGFKPRVTLRPKNGMRMILEASHARAKTEEAQSSTLG